ncbi:MAG: methylated-DNA--[protein]-cysteine S-methyltransferase [Bryobacteraceae bacterium]|nr:methylated-DNA--[protein]-cysteine S-methyltransferase [Bryobacteraceae bacterium]MDW8378220.1 methylated-DNA--[protein]-cysteine S-methyltransferase [Bryobacterales bacterium]
MRYRWMASPFGQLFLAGDSKGLRWLQFSCSQRPLKVEASWVRDDSAFGDVITQLEEYFAGKRRAFDVELAPSGPPFQQRVWELLRTIPYAETVSYGELARRFGNPAAARAVGQANRRNPLLILIPCHRVIGASGRLTGFSAGLDIKSRLLALERDSCLRRLE